jgi:hypothetical protein
MTTQCVCEACVTSTLPQAIPSPPLVIHHVDLAKVQTQQENRLWPFFSALESFFFAGLSEWNLKKIWKIQKNYSHTNSEWF